MLVPEEEPNAHPPTDPHTNEHGKEGQKGGGNRDMLTCKYKGLYLGNQTGSLCCGRCVTDLQSTSRLSLGGVYGVLVFSQLKPESHTGLSQFLEPVVIFTLRVVVGVTATGEWPR